MFDRCRQFIAERLANFLEAPVRNYRSLASVSPELLSRQLRPGDVLLVEGNHRISTAIKYLTQSTWSHSAVYVGDRFAERFPESGAHGLVEATLKGGVTVVPLAKYDSFNTRICRPDKLTADDLAAVLGFLGDSLGHTYDLKNVTDLMRYLLPTPPVPTHLRRRMLALGSGDPTRVICSTLIAKAFQSVRFPILPSVRQIEEKQEGVAGYARKEILHIRHFSLFAPRDFDLSPYFRVIKPTMEEGFFYKTAVWE